MSSRGGRKRDSIWEHFDGGKNESGNPQATCHFCHLTYSANPKRMKDHLAHACTQVPLEVRGRVAIALPTDGRKGGVVKDEGDRKRRKLAYNLGRGGRKKDHIWTYFEKRKSENGNPRAICQFCSNNYSANPKRMTEHIAHVCVKVDPAIRKLVASVQQANNQQADVQAFNNRRLSINGGGSEPRNFSTSLLKKEELAGKLSNDQESYINDRITLALLTENVSWKFLKNPFFKEALGVLNPSYKPMDVTAKNDVLSRLLDRVESKQNNFISTADNITLQINGTRNVKKECTINWLVVNDERSCELISIEKRQLNDSPTNYLQILNDKAASMPLHDSALLHFNTDSVDLLVKTRQKMLDEEVFCLIGSCLAHQSNFLLGDVIASYPSLLGVLKQCTEIGAFSNKSEDICDFIKNKLKVDQVYFANSSTGGWYSLAILVKQFLLIEDFVKDPGFSTLKTESCFERIIDDDNFWLVLKYADELFAPFNYLTALSELQNVTSGQHFAGWVWLVNLVHSSRNITIPQKEIIIQRFLRRIRLFFSDHYLLCSALDPRVHGIIFTHEGLRNIRAMLVDIACRIFKRKLNDVEIGGLIEEFYAFINKKHPFDNNGSWEYMSSNPTLFWKEFIPRQPPNIHLDCSEERKCETVCLAKIAISVIHYCPEVASCEHAWSALGNAHSVKCLSRTFSPKAGVIKHHYCEEAKKTSGTVSDVAKKYQKILGDIPTDVLFANDSNSLDCETEWELVGCNEGSGIDENSDKCGCVINAINKEDDDIDLEAIDPKFHSHSVTMGKFELSWIVCDDIKRIEELVKSFVSPNQK